MSLLNLPVNAAGPTFILFNCDKDISISGNGVFYKLHTASGSVIAQGSGVLGAFVAGKKYSQQGQLKEEWALIPLQPFNISITKYQKGTVFLDITFSPPTLQPYLQSNPTDVRSLPHSHVNGDCTYRAKNGYATNDLQFYNGDAQWM